MTLADRIVVLRAGRVEQVGAPMELYNDPANTFVAGFIGSPQMNFLKAGALGGRPEHLAITRDGGQMSGRVSHVEKLGGEALVYAMTEGQGLLTVRLFGEHDYTVDEAVGLTPDLDRIFRSTLVGNGCADRRVLAGKEEQATLRRCLCAGAQPGAQVLQGAAVVARPGPDHHIRG